MKKRIFLLIVMLFFCCKMVKFSTKAEESTLISNAKSGVLIEAKTKSILHEYEKDKRLFPASMTKIVTLKLTLDAIIDKRLTWNQLLTTSTYASSMGGSQIYLAPNEQMSVEDLFKSVAIVSANDAAVVLAEAISGSEANFVKLMNQEVEKLGLKNTNFANCTGLPIDNHYTSSYDMGMLAVNLLNKHEEEIIKYTSRYEDYIREETTKKFWLVNTNKMVRHVEGVDGLKTGWTEEAGYCITTTMKKNNMRLVSVIMGCESPDLRTKDTLSLLQFGFANYETNLILAKNTVIKKISNIKLNPQKINVVLADDFIYLQKIGEDTPLYTSKIFLDENKINRLHTENIGKIIFYNENGEEIDTITLNIEKNIKKSNFFKVLWELIKSIF